MCKICNLWRQRELSKNILKALKNRFACLIANHGQIAFGSSLAEAFELARRS